ncbi:hypothetical protein [Aquiflexum sp.]|uniref:hypothetical protein n=1 Tax=Aquiflexum sp. TaxID=1872584 RepID=UPI003593DB58
MGLLYHGYLGFFRFVVGISNPFYLGSGLQIPNSGNRGSLKTAILWSKSEDLNQVGLRNFYANQT